MTSHVPTLETCNRLKEAGFPQDTILSWSKGATPIIKIRLTQKTPYERTAAPILTEILELLPGDNPVEAAALLWLELHKQETDE